MRRRTAARRALALASRAARDHRAITALEYGLLGGVITVALASTPWLLGISLSARFAALNASI